MSNGMNDVLSKEFTEEIWEDVNGYKLLDKIKVFIAGDATACNYPHESDNNRYPRTGWGQVFGEVFDENVQVVNCALSGRSSKIFLTEPNFEYIEKNISEGDYLIIQFGHNDCKENDKSRYTYPNGTYEKCLQKYIDTAKSKGAEPILATSVTRNLPEDETLIPYCEAVKALGEKENIPVLDIFTLSHNQLMSEPEKHTLMYMNVEPMDKRFTGFADFKKSQYYETGDKDNTHLNIDGARYVSRLAAEELKRLQHPLAKHLKG